MTLGQKIFFENNGDDFSGKVQALAWCRENGISVGSGQRDARIGIKKGNYCIAKWGNMNQAELETLDGYINHDGNGYRHGKVGVVFFDTPAK